MIKYHPDNAFLQSFATGDLPASLAAAASIHCEMCSSCAQTVQSYTKQAATDGFSALDSRTENAEACSYRSMSSMDAMIEQITKDEEQDMASENQSKTIQVQGKQFELPRALVNIPLGKWSSLGRLSRSRLGMNDGDIRASLLLMEADGGVPEHTHKGFELTLILEGHFKDEFDDYGPGDFLMLDSNHTHNPQTDIGCLCYTVSNDAQHFTKGFNRLVNPLGYFIY
ncbi:ChrR family anti-sigma-E factor [Pseudohongiella nitratireducens]|uniref:ChrR family anti-sigma-E factor n=1 Tax=Pseudohongiella nitratireducens TaxID=1768907 RepID=UPI0030ECDC68|tara:strand:+ start:6099 stop:6776 length:678 start_codon:yes stop_codon:yes gene_type:complete